MRSPLLQGVDIKSDSSIIISCHISMREETETLDAYLPVYLEVMYGPVIW